MNYKLLKNFLPFFFLILFCIINNTIVFADGTTDKHVNNLSELKIAIEDDSINTIYLDQDIDFPNISASKMLINRSISIDGQNHIITNEGNNNLYCGFIFNKNNIEVTFRNINFGDQATKRSFSNWYGIIYGKGINQKLNVSNINYYSNGSGQPFYLPTDSDEITFSGNNAFLQEGNEQEWIEASNITFNSGSHTQVQNNSSGAGGCIWSYAGKGLNFIIEDQASVDIQTNKFFSWTDAKTNNILIGKNSKLKIEQTNPTKGTLSQNVNATYNLSVGENSDFEIYTPKSSPINDGTFTISKGATAYFHTKDDSFFNQVRPGPNFILDNPRKITFQADTDSSTNVIGLNRTNNFIFPPFSAGLSSYKIYTNTQILGTQNTTDSWSINKDISRNNNDFSLNDKQKLKQARIIELLAFGKIDFDANGGTPNFQETSSAMNSNVSIETLNLPNPIKDNYIFKGWSTSKNDPLTQVTSITPNYDGIKLYALWQPNFSEISSIDNFNFNNQIINGHNKANISASIGITDYLSPDIYNGWQLTVKYDESDLDTKKWLEANMELSLNPKTELPFVHTTSPFIINNQSQLVATISDETKKTSSNLLNIQLNPQLIAPNTVKIGSYKSILIWNLLNVPK